MMDLTQTPDALLDVWHETPVRVRYAETDRMGVVYHANYLIWFEIGRTEFCRARGFAYREMEENEDSWLVDAEGRVRSMPERYRQLLSAVPEEDIHTSQLPTRAGRVPDDSAP